MHTKMADAEEKVMTMRNKNNELQQQVHSLSPKGKVKNVLKLD
tara:strand:+ start:212 stop:340 length:129 start_codon:yes stop_codon:yes gene_type:complete